MDTSVILGIRPPVMQQVDPLERYGKSLALQHLLQQGELTGLQTQSARMGLADEQATRDAYQQSGGDPATLRALLFKGGQHKAVNAFDKLQLENQVKQSTIGKNQAEIPKIKQEAILKATAAHRDQLVNVNDPQTAAQWVTAGYNDPLLAPVLSRAGTAQEVIARIPQDPQGFMQWKQQNALGATKFIEMNKPSIHMQDVGGTSNVLSIPGMGGAPTTLSATPKTVTPGDTLTATTARRGQDITARGQDLTDARARETNQVTRESTQATRMNADTQALAKFIDSNALPGLVTSASAVDDMLKNYEGKGIPGTGRVIGSLPPILLTEEGKLVRSKLQAIGNDLLKLYSGGAVTASEAERRATEMMASGQFTDDDLRAAWPLVKGRVNASLQNVKAGFSPEAVAEYESRGGLKLKPIGGAMQKPKPVRVNSLSQADPAKFTGQIATGDDGIKYKSDGARWVRVP